MYNRLRSYSADLFNPSEATAKLKRSFSSRSLDLLSIDDDLELCGQEETGAIENEACCCYPISLDTCYDIISDTDAFQVPNLVLRESRSIPNQCEMLWTVFSISINNSLFSEKSARPSRPSWQQEIHIWSHKEMRWNSGTFRTGDYYWQNYSIHIEKRSAR